MDLNALPTWTVFALAMLGAWGLGIMLGCVLGSTWRESHPHPLSCSAVLLDVHDRDGRAPMPVAGIGDHDTAPIPVTHHQRGRHARWARIGALPSRASWDCRQLVFDRAADEIAAGNLDPERARALAAAADTVAF